MNFPYFTPQIPCNYELFRIVDSRKDRFLAYTSTKSPCQRCRQHRQSHPFWWVVKNDTVLIGAILVSLCLRELELVLRQTEYILAVDSKFGETSIAPLQNIGCDIDRPTNER